MFLSEAQKRNWPRRQRKSYLQVGDLDPEEQREELVRQFYSYTVNKNWYRGERKKMNVGDENREKSG